MVNLQVVMLSAPTSLASIMVIGGPHHAAVTHVGDSSEVGQREHMAFDSRWVPPVGGAPSRRTPAPEVRQRLGYAPSA
jgi:hypothetical protein